MPNGFLSSDPETIRLQLLGELEEDYRWYKCWSKFNKYLWNILNMAIIVLGAATSIVVAVSRNQTEAGLSWTDWVTMAMPALASLASAFLLQWRVYEKWQLREEGRIDLAELICKAYLIPRDKPGEFLARAVRLRRRAVEIERIQARRFFALAPKEPRPNSGQAD
jgi:hypothetical protein